MVDQHQHQQAGYTEAEWLGAQADPILGERVIGWVLDTGEHVVFDGVSRFSELPRYGGPIGASAVVSPANDGTNGLFGVPGVALDPNDSRTDSFTGGITYYFPFEMSQAGTVDTAIFEVTSAATGGATARVAIATADGDWQPATLVADLGEKAIDATGVKTYTPAQALSAGRHLLGYRGSATATLRNLQGAPLNFGGIRGDGSFGTTPWINQIRVTEAYGAFADPPTAWDSATAGASGFRQPVLLGWT